MNNILGDPAVMSFIAGILGVFLASIGEYILQRHQEKHSLEVRANTDMPCFVYKVVPHKADQTLIDANQHEVQIGRQLYLIDLEITNLGGLCSLIDYCISWNDNDPIWCQLSPVLTDETISIQHALTSLDRNRSSFMNAQKTSVPKRLCWHYTFRYQGTNNVLYKQDVIVNIDTKDANSISQLIHHLAVGFVVPNVWRTPIQAYANAWEYESVWEKLRKKLFLIRKKPSLMKKLFLIRKKPSLINMHLEFQANMQDNPQEYFRNHII